MIKKAYISFSYLFCSSFIYAQYCDTVSFQKIFWNQGIHNARPRNVSVNSSGNIYIIGSTESPTNNSEDMWILKTTPGGNVIWSKCFGLQKDEELNGLRNTSDGGFLLTGTTNSVSTFQQGWIVKTDSNANVQWSVVLGSQYSSLSQIVQLDDDSYAAVGTLYTDFSGDSSGNITLIKKATNIILHLNKNGNLIWWRSFGYSDNNALKTVTQLKDGALMVTGVSTDLKAGYVLKLNKDNGSVIWMNGYDKYNQYAFPRASEQADGTIHLHVGNRTFFLTADGKYFDGREIELNSNSLSLNDVQVVDVGRISDDTELYEANLYPKHSPILFTVQDDSVVLWAHQYQSTPDKLQRLINGRINKNKIYVAGSYVTDNLSDNSGNEELSYLIKADANGSTLCSDTFNVSFKIDVISYPQNVAYSWKDEGSLNPFFVYPNIEILNAESKDDCQIENCCKAVNRDTNVTLCNGDFYKLPPNDSTVKTSGIYSFKYPKPQGCDSIVNYKVQFKNLFTFSLGNDTCLINNQPVTFSLPEDSSVVYHWQNGSVTNTFTATVPGIYWATATSSCNIYKDSVTVNAVCSMPVFVPSAFTPNGDGLNDVFRVTQLNRQRLTFLSVYNRLGQNIFYSKDSGKGWDGNCNGIKQPTGTYIYIAGYFDFEGTIHTLNGTVVLLR